MLAEKCDKIIIITYPLTARVDGAPRMISQPVSSIFLFSPLPSPLVRKRFRSGVNIARTRSFPGVEIESDHDLLMMTFRLRLKKISNPKHTRLKFDLEELKDPNVLETFQAIIGGRFAPLTIMSNEHTDIDSMITTFNTAVTETASEILGKHR